MKLNPSSGNRTDAECPLVDVTPEVETLPEVTAAWLKQANAQRTGAFTPERTVNRPQNHGG